MLNISCIYIITKPELFHLFLQPVNLRHRASIVLPAFYFIFQAFRFVTLVMFSIFMVDCSVFNNKTSIDCDINFTIYRTAGCDVYCWKGLWVGCSAVTAVIWLLVLCLPTTFQLIQEIRPASNLTIIRSLVVKPYFWYLNFIVILVFIYDVVTVCQEHVYGSDQVEIGVTLSKLLTTALIFQLNFTYPPSTSRHFPWHVIALYYITLSIFLLDYFCKFLELSIRIAYKLYTINAIRTNRAIQVVNLMLDVADAALYNYFTTFFWNKMFRGNSDVLRTFSPDLAESLRIHDDLGRGSGDRKPNRRRLSAP